METKNGAAVTPSYEDFEPFCSWHREEGCETLVVHLPAFKKEQLKVQINNLKTLKISRERPVDATEMSLFYKEIRVPKGCIANEIDAKFVDGLLHIVMPKKGSLAARQQEEATEIQQSQVNENSKPEIYQDQVTKVPTLAKTGDATEKIVSPNNATTSRDKPMDHEFQPDSRLRSLSKMAIHIAAAVAVLSAFNAYVMYSYSSLYGED